MEKARDETLLVIVIPYGLARRFMLEERKDLDRLQWAISSDG